MMRTAGVRRFLNLSGLHGYIYGRWIKEYIGFLMNVVYPRVGKGGRKWLTDHYHGKVLPLELAEAIVQVDRDIPLHDLEHVIPYPVARDLVLKSPPDIAVFQCGCRQNRAEPCEPVEVCMVIGQPFVDFVLDHHPQSSRALTQEEALNLLQAEHERGHMHTAWFKDAAMDRFYAICNCCRCCCGGLEAMTRYGARSLTSSGYVAQVDAELCSGCATCADLCSFDAIQVNGSSAISWEECMGCGVCVGHCPSEAMSLVLDERKGTPLDVRLMLPELQPA
jgi:Pyruvate/2-oxoacid:ferredoxin oxidoreductase delta subunit